MSQLSQKAYQTNYFLLRQCLTLSSLPQTYLPIYVVEILRSSILLKSQSISVISLFMSLLKSNFEVGNYMVLVMWAVLTIFFVVNDKLNSPISVGGRVVWKLLMRATLIF